MTPPGGECALFLRRVPAAGLSPGRLYIGDETCERRLPSEELLAWIEGECPAPHWPLTVATPPLTDSGLALLEGVLRRLSRMRPGGFEVAVNDLGALELLRGFPKAEPVCGRLLAGRYMHFPEFPDEFLDFLAVRGISRVEINSRSQLQTTREQLRSRGLRAHFHWPHMFVAVTRFCAAADGFAGHPRDAIAACSRGCERFTGTYAVGGTELLVCGNALWTKHPGPAQPPEEADRIVSDELMPAPPQLH
ncbi:MAG: hypothetical protein NTY77_08030 [Elusimicrobia bacterium]|nr:hypothetical protein [Elusimicrobiota bacterium]